MSGAITVRKLCFGVLSNLNGVIAAGAVVLALSDLMGGVAAGGVWVFIFAVYALLNVTMLRPSACVVFIAAILLAFGTSKWSDIPFGPPLEQAGFFFALLVALKMLGVAATRSPDIIAGAGIIVSRSSGLRYLFLTFGTHFFALLLNIGSVLLMMSMLSTRLRQESEETVRSLTLAVVRGLAGTSAWSPLSLSMLITLSLVDGVSYWDLAPLGILAAIFYMMAGYFIDARHHPVEGSRLGLPSHQERLILLRILLRIASFMVGIFALVWTFKLRLIDGVLLSGLGVSFFWIAFQKRSKDKEISFIKDLRLSASTLGNEVVTIAGAAFIGSLSADLIMAWHGFEETLSSALTISAAAVIPLGIVLAGMLAINPLVSVSILAGALTPAWPAEAKVWLALALVWGWSLAASGTPFTANMLMAAHAISRNPVEIALSWNVRLTVISLLTAGLACSVATFLALKG